MNDQQIQQARSARTPDELRELARSAGIQWTEEQAAEVYARLHPAEGEAADLELTAVSGGGCGVLPPVCEVFEIGALVTHQKGSYAKPCRHLLHHPESMCQSTSFQVTGQRTGATVSQSSLGAEYRLRCTVCGAEAWVINSDLKRL